MTLRTRRSLLLLCLTVFLAALGPILLYTFGYRINWHTFALEKTGGLYIAVQPTGADIFIDGHLARATSFLSRGILIQNLNPNAYEIRVGKDGFLPWAKTLTIKPGQVFEARIVLTPRSPSGDILARDGLQSMMPSPSGAWILFRQKMGQGASAALRLYNVSTGDFLPYQDTASARLALKPQFLPEHVFWRAGEQSLIADTGDDWLRLTIQNDKLSAESLFRAGELRSVFKTKPRLVMPHPRDSQGMIILDGTNLYLWGSAKSSHKPILQSIASVAAGNDHILLLDNQSGTLYRTLLDATTPEAVSPAHIPLPLEDAHIQELSNGRWLVASARGSWLLAANDAVPFLLAREPVTARFTDDDHTLLWWTPRALSVRWLETERNLPYYQTAPETLLFTADPGREIRGSYHYPSQDYAIAAIAEGVYIIEFDGRGNARDVATLYKGKQPQVWVPPGQQTNAYILDDGNFIKMELQKPFTSGQ